MPAQKRNSSSENLLHDDDSLQQHYRRKQSRPERGGAEEEEEEDDEEDKRDDEELKEGDDPEGEDSDGSRSSDDPAKLSEWLFVQLPALRTYVQCPICLGIIKKTRTVMECLHRFCRECIDKSMRMGNNECPACRTHCASRRSLRDDPRFDAMIESLYNDIEKYEEEELAFHEEEKTRNKQIQASIAQIFQRQSEALVTRRQKGKDTASASNARLPRNGNAYSRRRRKNRGAEPEGSEDNEEENNHDENKDSSSTDERGTETKQRRYKRRAGAQSSRPSLSAVTADGGAIENDLEAYKEGKAASSGPVRNPEILAWGGGAARSKSVRNTRIMKLTKYFGPANLKKNDDKLDVHLMLTSLDKQRMPSLQQLYLCCPPRFSVEHLKKYVARETQLRADDIEILMVMKQLNTNDLQSTLLDPLTSMENQVVFQILHGPEPLADLRPNGASIPNHLILAYRLKGRD
ncbi:putative E3 ubiquitin-protein ligase RING1a [Camellia sinensis]|uniref:putative E3 ubiquitin-protein ligase RING1a n=1 Tax=Camellia sinensis TaxID=4442 RepID=UPI001036E4F6|nr:putative E3 ubiquitin-protein ligase RING1a [Camellia sinensis]